MEFTKAFVRRHFHHGIRRHSFARAKEPRPGVQRAGADLRAATHLPVCGLSCWGKWKHAECVVARLRCKIPIAGTIFRVFLCARAAAVIPASTGEFAAAVGAGYKAVGQLDKLR